MQFFLTHLTYLGFLKISLEFVDYLEKIINKDREVEDLVPELYKFALEGA